jgi:hypothetical protein
LQVSQRHERELKGWGDSYLTASVINAA